MAKTAKILLAGDLSRHQLQPALTKIASLHAKNDFSFCIITGDIFGDDGDDEVTQLLDGRLTFPLPTYFTVGSRPLPHKVIARIESDEEICPNLHYLGKRSTTKTSEDIRIVTLGGQLDANIVGGLSTEQILPFHTVGDAKALHGAKSADILLTSCWPSSIRNGSQQQNPEEATDPAGLDHIAELCKAIKPRYHISRSDLFFEREPFFHRPSAEHPDYKPVTRFISMAPYGNKQKQKVIYAFNLAVPTDMTAQPPPGTTIMPFVKQTNGHSRRMGEDTFHSKRDYTERDHHRRRGAARKPLPGPQECFFCLSNPNYATHLVASIGEDAYLAAAKGPLTTVKTFATSGLNFPCNAIIIPLTHAPTLALIENDDQTRQKTYDEMVRFRTTLQQMIHHVSKGALGAVTYDISKDNLVHTHWQFLPVPAAQVRKGLVEAAFRIEAENLKYAPFETRDPRIGEREGDFFRVWIWCGADEGNDEYETCITMPIDHRMRFSLQFGRIVLAKLLGLEDRIQWRNCAQTMEEESQETELFKAAFKEFDFTL